LKSITGQDNPYIGWTSGSLLNNTQAGNVIVGAGRLVKSPSNATVFMTDGYDKLVPMTSFNSPYDIGLNPNIRMISDEYLSKYTVDSTVLSSYVSCGGVNYLGLGGVAYQLTINGKSPRVLQPQTCNILTKSTTMPRFINGPDGTIYELTNGVLHPITSWSKFVTLSASGGSMVHVSATSLTYLPVGSSI
jgi:hypothetical protein